MAKGIVTRKDIHLFKFALTAKNRESTVELITIVTRSWLSCEIEHVIRTQDCGWEEQSWIGGRSHRCNKPHNIMTCAVSFIHSKVSAVGVIDP